MFSIIGATYGEYRIEREREKRLNTKIITIIIAKTKRIDENPRIIELSLTNSTKLIELRELKRFSMILFNRS